MVPCVAIGGSDDSDEHARPVRKGRAGKQPMYADPPSDPDNTPTDDEFDISDAEESDGDYEAEEVIPETTSRPKLNVHRKPRGSSSAADASDAAAHGDAPNMPRVHISCEPAVYTGRVMKDYLKVPLSAYRVLRRDNQFEAPEDCVDPRFRTNVQADIFTSVALTKGLTNSQACIPLEYIRSHPSQFPGVMEIVDDMGLAPIFGLRHH